MNGLQKNILKAALLAVTLCALPALAGPDTYGVGTGKDGAPPAVNTAGTIVNFYSQLTAPAAPGDTTLVVSTTTNFSAGDLVLVMQMTGIVPEPPSGGPSPIDITNDPVGRWELARLTGVTATSMTLDVPLVNSYAANVTQVIRVREYTNLTINTPGFITAPAWNGSTGGVVALLASGTLAINAFPAVNVTGRGFRGGTAVDDASGSTGCTGLDEPAQTGAQKGEGIALTRFGPTQTGRGHVANGGAGGVCLKSGGGGGGNGGTGGQGGNSELNLDGNRNVGGQGGTALTFNPINHLVMGGGGGAGHVATIGATTVTGGAGGGIIFIRANAMSGAGNMVANGATGGSTTGDDAASGGGGGGTIHVRIVATPAACGFLQAIGGTGGNANGGSAVGPGGGGGGGHVLVQRGATGTCGPRAGDANGSSAGVQQDATVPGGSAYGAQPGSAGTRTIITTSFPATMPVPVVTTPANGSVTNDNTPTYSGTLPSTPPAGSQVAIYVDGAEVTRVTPTGTTWTFTPTVPLAEGSHTIYAITVNTTEAVQSVKSNTNTFTVDVTPPPAPVVVTPANGSVTNDNTPTYSGTAEANSTVSVYVDNVLVGTTTANASGNWSFTPTTALPDGSHQVKATASDAVGNTSGDSNTNTFTVDATPPPAPVVVTPANGSRTNDNTPTYTGTAEANSTVNVYLDGALLGTTTADATGNWTFTQPTPLADGNYAVKATATDAAGNTSVDSNTNTFLVDTVPPPAPVVFTPPDGSITSNNRPVYTGSASGAVSVRVFVDGVEVGITIVTGGSWSFTQPTDLPDGVHNVKVISVDGAGNTSADSNTNTFTVDTAPPAAPVVLTPANGSVTNDNTPAYTGTAEPNSTVTVYVDGAQVGTTPADASGNWTLTQPAALADGSHQVKATATDVANNVSPDSNINTFTVDTVPPAAPVVVTPANGSVTSDNTPTYTGTAEPNSTVTVYVDGTAVGTTTANASGDWSFTPTTPLADGFYQVKATATDAAGNTSGDSNTNAFTVDTTPPAAPVVLTPANGSSIPTTTPTYTGTADATSTVTVYVDGVQVGTTTADGLGNWTFTQPTSLANGSHQVKATATDAAGNTSGDSNTNTFTVDTLSPDAPVVLTPADGSRTNDTTPTYTGTAEPNNTIFVMVDFTTVGTTTSNASGDWSFTPTTPLAEGSHTVRVYARDAAGNSSLDSNTNTFTVDLTPPAAPVVTTPANGAVLADNTPTYTGTAEANSTVTVIVDGTPVGTTTADASGNWSFTPTTGLSNGQHSVKATATDAAGNASPESNTNTFTVNATIPAAPVVTGPTEGTVTSDTTPTYTGTAEPGSTVTILIGGNPVGTTTADASGNWTFTPTTPLADAQYTLTATATNNAGNVSPPSTAVHFTVDTAAPDTTIVSGPSGDTEDPDATFDFSSEAGATFECSLDGGSYAPCTDPSTFENLAPGQHTLSVRARDSAGNVDPTPATANWNVVEPSPGSNLNFRGGGVGCASTGGDPSALAMMGLAALSALLARKRRA